MANAFGEIGAEGSDAPENAGTPNAVSGAAAPPHVEPVPHVDPAPYAAPPYAPPPAVYFWDDFAYVSSAHVAIFGSR